MMGIRPRTLLALLLVCATVSWRQEPRVCAAVGLCAAGPGAGESGAAGRPTADPLAAKPLSPREKSRVLAAIDSLYAQALKDSSQTLIADQIELARAARDSGFLVDLLVRQGGQRASFGYGREAESGLTEAVAVAEAVRDTGRVCHALRWLAVAVESQGRSSEAQTHYGRQLDLALAIGDLRNEAWARVGLAYHGEKAGRFADSIRHYRRAVALFNQLQDGQAESWALNGLGVVLNQNEQFDEALSCYRRSAEIARRLDYAMVEALAENNLGTLQFALGDPGAAVRHFEQAHAIQQRLGHARAAVTPWLNMAYCQKALGCFGTARDILREVLTDTAERGYADLHAVGLTNLAELQAWQDHRGEAADLYREALSYPQLDLKTRITAMTGLARSLAAQDSLDAALEVLHRGTSLLREPAFGDVRLDFELAFGEVLQRSGQPRAALAHYRIVNREALKLGFSGLRVEAMAAAAGIHRALGEADSSLALLLQAAEIWEAERSLPLDPEWREQRGANGRVIYTRLGEHLLNDRPDLPLREKVRDAFDRLQAFKARTLLERMLGPGRAGSDSTAEVPGSVSLQRLQEQILQDGEVFLDVYLGAELSLLFAVTRDTCLAVRWPAAGALSDRLRMFHDLCAFPAVSGARLYEDEDKDEALAALQTAAGHLENLLFGDVFALVAGADRIILAPDGVLCLLSLAALPAARPAADGAFASLLDGAEWVQIPSATVLGHLRQRAADAASDDAVCGLAMAAGNDGMDALTGAVAEVRRLGRRYRGIEVVVAGQDQPGLSIDSLSRYDLIHLASHVRPDDGAPWQSEIRLPMLTDREGLRAAQVARLDLSARLAVLASCASAAGRVLSGEGVLGLTSAFLSAGVPAVVATLWAVEDRTTAKLMESFYREMAAGSKAASALRQAQLALKADPRTAHPFYWAGFVLVGDGDVALPLTPRPRPPWAVAAILVIMAGATAVWVVRGGRRRKRS
jgi:tetratricopeptide (TPR) repeat protein